MKYNIKGVEALYPKLDRPYKFDNTENRSVPCTATDDGAEYTVNLKIAYADIAPLRKAMVKVYNEKKAKDWPVFKDNFKLLEGTIKDKDAIFDVKVKIKAAYNKEATRKPRQFSAANEILPDEFQLTTGSIINVAVVLVPYFMKATKMAGVTLRLNAVQVIKLAESSVTSPFEVEDGFTVEADNPFSEEAVEEKEVTKDDGTDQIWDEEPEEPKKVVKKKKAPPKKDDDDDLDAIIDEWGDDD
jgi:hypothetical protein|tara:strand:- start:4137 stop:4865 length:729 start_codon:yes stop_codon:yes gene_type:complete